MGHGWTAYLLMSSCAIRPLDIPAFGIFGLRTEAKQRLRKPLGLWACQLSRT